MNRQSRQPALILAAGIAVLCLVLQLGGLEPVLRYDRQLISQGDAWLLLTGNFVHLGVRHLALNLVGFALIVALVWVNFSTLQWFLLFIASSLGVGIGLFWLNPELDWYVGLSGTLHGLLIAGALADLRRYRWQASLLLLVICLKLGLEQLAGPIPGSEAAAGGAVVVDSHLYGAIAGGLVGAALLLTRRLHRHQPPSI